MPIQPVTAMAMMIGNTPGFMMRIRSTTQSICGMEAINSQKRIMMLSAAPPK